ncbi:DUF4166 domain-containing protein [Bacillus sp. SL00103]
MDLQNGSTVSLFFPERGKNIPFQIVNEPFVTNRGEEGCTGIERFISQRRSGTLMQMIIDHESHTVLDYFGKPRLLVSELHFTVTYHGFLHIQSGRQKFLMFGKEWPAPSWLSGVSDVNRRLR